MENKLIEFKEIIEDSENNYSEIEVNDLTFLENLIFVFEHYGEDFVVKEGKVYVPIKTFEDKEYCKNLCLKARDKEWIKNNK